MAMLPIENLFSEFCFISFFASSSLHVFLNFFDSRIPFLSLSPSPFHNAPIELTMWKQLRPLPFSNANQSQQYHKTTGTTMTEIIIAEWNCTRTNRKESDWIILESWAFSSFFLSSNFACLRFGSTRTDDLKFTLKLLKSPTLPFECYERNEQQNMSNSSVRNGIVSMDVWRDAITIRYFRVASIRRKKIIKFSLCHFS